MANQILAGGGALSASSASQKVDVGSSRDCDPWLGASSLEPKGSGQCLAREDLQLQANNPELGADLYLELMKKCLTRYIFPETHRPLVRPLWGAGPLACTAGFLYSLVQPVLAAKDLKIFRCQPFDAPRRADGKDWPAEADTMVGLKRLDNLQFCVTEALRANVPGDLIETGVWRGGASIFMRAVLKAYGDRTRLVWVADSFEGLPKPDGRYQQDTGDVSWKFKSTLGVSLEQVKSNFARYGLLDNQVRFLAGWFKDTLPDAPFTRLAVLRLDGDMYSSTMDALQNLYPKLSPGGYVIVDDYGGVAACKQAVEDFRKGCGIKEPMERIDWTGVFWQKGAEL
jgi:O-methyltransferase